LADTAAAGTAQSLDMVAVPADMVSGILRVIQSEPAILPLGATSVAACSETGALQT
jgi:hypothetical protein